jgi:hypothetical protein
MADARTAAAQPAAAGAHRDAERSDHGTQRRAEGADRLLDGYSRDMSDRNHSDSRHYTIIRANCYERVISPID